MYSTKSRVGVTETEQQVERRRAAVNILCSVTSATDDSKCASNVCLSEYDVVSRLQLVCALCYSIVMYITFTPHFKGKRTCINTI